MAPQLRRISPSCIFLFNMFLMKVINKQSYSCVKNVYTYQSQSELHFLCVSIIYAKIFGELRKLIRN
jgi:hypothetical protein